LAERLANPFVLSNTATFQLYITAMKMVKIERRRVATLISPSRWDAFFEYMDGMTKPVWIHRKGRQ